MSVFDTMYKWIKTGASDAAAAVGEIFPIAGLYQATPTEVNDGYLGRLRMSARRVLLGAADAEESVATETWTAENDGRILIDIEWPRWARYATIHVKNGGDQYIDIKIYLYDSRNTLDGGYFEFLYDVEDDMAAGDRKTYAWTAAGTGSNRYTQVPGLARNHYPMSIRLNIKPAAAMTGSVLATVVWSS